MIILSYRVKLAFRKFASFQRFFNTGDIFQMGIEIIQKIFIKLCDNVTKFRFHFSNFYSVNYSS
ncbi:hypothetical protein BCM35_03435 [Helicobacter winghamensis]|nr:hypothetical protein BCM34_07350 [Helicobacter winghamensis]PKT77123.1 hypothetical protein BCM35_03435 [Helicobacter winghamensis]